MKKLILCVLFIVMCISTTSFGYTTVRLGPEYFPETSRGRPIALGSIYVGQPDLDPEIVGNQKTLSVQQEDGTIVAVAQPIYTNAGGVPVYAGSPVTLLVEGTYSLKVLDSSDAQIYYVPSTTSDDSDAQDNCYPVYTAADQGVTGDNDTLKYCIDTIGADQATIVLRHNSGAATTTYTLTTAETIPANITLQVERGAVIAGAGTLTMNGQLDSPILQQVLTTTFSFVPGPFIKEVSPQMWGAVADNVTDDHDAIQACISSVMAITSGPKPVIRLIGEYAYTQNIQTLGDGSGLAYGVVIRGNAGGRRGDAATLEGLTTLTNIGIGSFQFGQIDTVANRDWMIGSTMENIQFVGNANVDVGLLTASNNCIFKNIHVTGYTKTNAIGWQRTGEINSFYDCSMTNNYIGGSSRVGGHASGSNNLNNYYSCVWNSNTAYGDNPTAEHGAAYYGCLWQSNGADGYNHSTAGKATKFFGGWFENNNITTAGYQLELIGTSAISKAEYFQIYGTTFTAGGASMTGQINTQYTDHARLYPAWSGVFAVMLNDAGDNTDLESNLNLVKNKILNLGAVPHSTTETVTVTTATGNGVIDITFYFFGNAAGNYGTLRLSAGGYLPWSAAYSVEDIIRVAAGTLTLSAVTKANGSFSFTVQNTSGADTMNVGCIYSASAEVTSVIMN
jgi:hypothetical protein